MGYPTEDEFEEARRHRSPPRARPGHNQFSVELDFDFSDLYTKEEYEKEHPGSDVTYERYRSRCREAALKNELTRMRFQLMEWGYTHGEVVRSILDEAQECCRYQP